MELWQRWSGNWYCNSAPVLVKMFPSLRLYHPQMRPNVFYCFVKNLYLGIALWVGWRGSSVRHIHELHHLCRKFVHKFFSTICVDLSRNSKFVKPLLKNGVSNCFSILFLDRYDYSIFGECIGDAQHKFFVTVSCQHRPE